MTEPVSLHDAEQTLEATQAKRYATYPAYRPSGVDWLGDVPEHWETWKAAHAFAQIGSGTTPPSDDDTWYEGEINWVTTSELRETIITETRKKISREALAVYSALKLFPAGSVAIAMYGATIGRLGILGSPATTNQACCVLAPGKIIDTKFLYYCLWTSRNFIINLSSGGGQPNISQEKIRSLRLPRPPEDEQQAIARFLDEQTKKIDDLIEAKRDLLALLKEKRQAVISHAVTKGLNPDARLKPSGVDWLGDVPEHWEVKPLKYIASIKTGFAFSSDDFVDEGVPLLRIGDIGRDGKVHMDAAKHLPINYIHRYRDFLISSGDIVMAMTGATIGKAGRYNANSAALLNQRVCSISALTKDRQDFLWFLLNAPFYMEYILLTAFGGAQPNISDKELLDCSAPVPPCDEQHAIAEYLNAKTAKIDRLSAEVETASDRLRDYRTALISAAVTGKIDVRGGAT